MTQNKTLITMIMLLACTIAGTAQTIHYPFGAADESTVAITSDTAVDFSTDNLVEFVTVTADTNITFNATPSASQRDGSLLYLQVIADATKRYVYFGTSLDGNTDSVTASYNKYYYLLYHNGSYRLLGKSDEIAN